MNALLRARQVAPPVGVPRLLARPSPAAFTPDLGGHADRWGPLPEGGPALIDTVDAAGLRGRGGAGFPTGRKMRAVAAGRSRRRGRPVVVANGAEGEPASRKDALLLAHHPHLVLDGAQLAASAVGADQLIIATHRGSPATAALSAAATERHAAGWDPVPVEVVAGPDRYVASHESALVHWLGGGEAKPTSAPPRPFERGVRGRPTLVQNVETLAHLALIARFGGDWFRGVGTPEEPGSILLTVSGAVHAPGVYEVAGDTSLVDAVGHAGGPSTDIHAVLLGGYFGGWIPAGRAAGLRLGHGELGALGGTLGCGVVLTLPDRVCGLAETARVARWLAGESAGQCGPCTFGLPAIADAVDALAGPVRPGRAAPARAVDRGGAGPRRLPPSRRRRPLRRERAGRLRRRDRLACPGPLHGRPACGPGLPAANPPPRGRAMAMTGRLSVDPIACVGHGLCAELLPEHVRLDDWGYPIVDRGPVPPGRLDHARQAVAACPTLALRLVATRGGPGARPARARATRRVRRGGVGEVDGAGPATRTSDGPAVSGV